MASQSAVHRVELPRLLETLKQQFSLVPNYPRLLDGRIVQCGMTDWEVAGRRLWPGATTEQAIDLGKRVRQVWYFRVDCVRLRFNDYYDQHPHLGVQYGATCGDCGAEVWVHANRRAPQRCRACHLRQFAVTPRCEDTGVACSTAYTHQGCRCQECRAWNAAKHRRLRAARNHVVSSAETEAPNPPEILLLRRTNHVVMQQPWDPQEWTWLPGAVRAVLAMYAEASWAEYDEIEKAAA